MKSCWKSKDSSGEICSKENYDYRTLYIYLPGATEPQPAAASPIASPVSDVQDETERDPEPFKAEWLPDPAMSPSGELPIPFESITESAPVIDPSDAPAKLASRFFEYQGSPVKYRADLPGWTEKFRSLMQTYGDELPELMDYAFKIASFWSEKLIRGRDPLGYFEG